jgi:predicted enzyme related to lactoylglutathione lyase
VTELHAQDRWSIAPVLVVGNVAAAANYYRDVLGFTYDRIWGDPPSFCMVRRAGIVVMLNQLGGAASARPNSAVDPEREAWDAYIWVPDADALHSELAAKGARFARDPCDQPYGCRDFDVEDLDGYRLCFGHPLERA